MIISGLRDIARNMGLNPQTVSRWAKKHGLPAARIAGRYVTTTDLIEHWILQNAIDRRAKPTRPRTGPA